MWPWYASCTTIQTRPATGFNDVKTMLGPKQRPDANVCWCLSYRIPSKENQALTGPARGERVEQLIREAGPIGVLAYDGDEVVGRAGFTKAADTDSVLSGFPRVLMRFDLS